MKTWWSLGCLAALAAAVSTTNLAFTGEPIGGARVKIGEGEVRVDIGTKVGQNAAALRVSDILGGQVYNKADENLGKIEDLVIDPGSGRLRYAVLSFGGLLGMGDKLFAVPWGELTMVTKGRTSAGTIQEDHFVLNVSKETLKNAPGFDKNRWPNFANKDWAAGVDDYYMTNRARSTDSRVR